MAALAAAGKPQPLRVVSWNIAAINNNPFEYWISHDDAAYNSLMSDVEEFIRNPGDSDVPVHEVFTDVMFAELAKRMTAHGWDGVEETKEFWVNDFRNRRIVSGFIQDGVLGMKRLASMPDRVTNTINLADGTQAYRPTPINCYPGTFSSFKDWWKKWTTFMFSTTLQLKIKGEVKDLKPADLLIPITQAKYPAVNSLEERISLPLQTTCAAIFDAIQVHMLEQVAPGTWQPLRHELSQALNAGKNERTLEILENAYADADVIFLQEVANAFVSTMESRPGLLEKFTPIVPVTSGKRDQNSIILIRRELLGSEASVEDVTSLLAEQFEGKKVPIAEGDLVVATAYIPSWERKLVLASFHGDTNGLATIPVVDAVHQVMTEKLSKSGDPISLIFGLDANTYEVGKPGKTQDVSEFVSWLGEQGLTSCWGDTPRPQEYTTYNARTYLQPQLNKATSKSEVRAKGDVNPKDFILFYGDQLSLTPGTSTSKDNTGQGNYVDDMVFPTLAFPSDHAIISAQLEPR